jgi:glycosyltransferase involved in cell wall biosynthesis
MCEVSVIVTSYNHQKYILDAVDSVLNQSFDDYEVIVIDDFSTDNSYRMLVEKYSNNNRVSILLNPKNFGVAGSLNIAISKAKGKYVALLGSDDLMHYERLKTQYEFLENNPKFVGCGSNVLRIDSEGVALKSQTIKGSAELGGNNFTSFNFYFPAPSAMYLTEAVKDIGCFKCGAIVEDLDFWIRLTSNEKLLFLIDEVLTSYRVHGGSVSSDPVKMFGSIISLIEDNKSLLPFKKLKLLNFLRYSKRTLFKLDFISFGKVCKIYFLSLL